MTTTTLRYVALGVLVMVLAAIAVLQVSRPSTPDLAAPLSPTPRSIADLVESSGGQEIVVPNGTYEGGVVSAMHTDWLVLRAETRGGVVVDLRTSGLRLEAPTRKVVFVGFRFVDGMVRLGGVEDVHFWYCEFEFPAEEWDRQFRAAGGDAPAHRSQRSAMITSMANPLPTALRIRSVDGHRNARIGVFGSDIHHVGDDGIFFTSVDGLRLEGVRIWDVDEKGFDPGHSFGDDADWFHNDALQTAGSVRDIEIRDSWFGQKVQWTAQEQDIVDATFERVWIAGSRTWAQIVGVHGEGRILRNRQRAILIFGNRHADRVDYVDGVRQALWPDQHHDAGRFEMTTDAGTALPAGISLNQDGVADAELVRDHAMNPANQWRAAHPYESYGDHLDLDLG